MKPLRMKWYEEDEVKNRWMFVLNRGIQLAVPDHPIFNISAMWQDLTPPYFKKIDWKIYKAVFKKSKP